MKPTIPDYIFFFSLLGLLAAYMIALLFFPRTDASPAVIPSPTPSQTLGTYYQFQEEVEAVGILGPRETILRDVNRERRAVGLSPVAYDARLDAAALLKANHLARVNCFCHEHEDIPSIGGLALEAGYDSPRSYVRENLNRGFAPSASVEAWMNSPSHRAAILDPAVTHMGIALVKADMVKQDELLIVQWLGFEDEVINLPL